MTKFSALSISDLMTDTANAGRVARRAAYAVGVAGEIEPCDFLYVVMCEASDGSWCEFDAETLLHGSRLADNAVEKLGARGCSVWRVNADGSLACISSYHIYESVA